ncbi:MFS transporter [Ruania halotolerans]|uniref:MFS transporter n=1 Tax=Ruania halotolerans TaxID=2897773 RepID=UPI001E285737|nr:MFS transporter [Ruania halotolerans]UFU06345.1 MFS transporter [Ruania halotolerans]
MDRRLLPSLVAANLVLAVMYAAVAGVLVPAQVARAAPEDKEAVLAVIMTASSLLTVLMRPALGVATDRTRSRWGQRSPWLVGGAAGAALALVLLGQASTALAIGVGWLIVQPALNTIEAPLDAVLADRVPESQRPRVSAFFGAGAAVGLAVGAGGAGLLLGFEGIYPALAVLLLATVVAFVLLNPERGTRPRGPSLSLRHAWRSPALRIVFGGRFTLVLGQQLVLGYLLYLVMDRTGAQVEEAGRLVTVLTGVHILAIVTGAVIASRVVGPRRVPWVLVATGLIALGLVIALVWPGIGGLAGYAVVAGAGRGLYLSADLALMLDLLPSPADAGRDLGVLGLATILPQVLAPALAGAVLVLTGGQYSWLFALALVAVATSGAIMARLLRRPYDPEPLPVKRP